MKRNGLIALFLCLILTAGCASAEIRLPTFESYAEPTPEVIGTAENGETVTGQYYTDSGSVAEYRALLEAEGFLQSGQWVLPGGDGFDRIDVYAYTWIGSEAPAVFRMTVGEDSFSAHILLQAAALTDGRTLMGMTCSAGIGFFEYVKPTPTPEPTPSPTPAPAGMCTHCDKGRCRECGGTGRQRCGICNGSGTCPTCGGKRRYYISGYGVGTGSYVDCQGCYGSGKCWRCNGSRTEDCMWCDGGVCPYCHGDYLP